jgi:hypothetical protein
MNTRGIVMAAMALAFARSLTATSCVTVPPNVRAAAIVAEGRYAGERTFTIETILRTRGDRPAKVVAPEDWRSSPCSPPEPVPGRAYLVLVYPSGAVGYVPDEAAEYPRSQLRSLHVVTSRSVLDLLDRYAHGRIGRDAAEDWLGTAVFDPPRDESFGNELLSYAERLLGMIAISEACNKDLVAELRDHRIPAAVRAIGKGLPDVDTEEEHVARRIAGIADGSKREAEEDKVLDEWDDTLAVLNDLGTISEELRKLPWCDHEKYGW